MATGQRQQPSSQGGDQEQLLSALLRNDFGRFEQLLRCASVDPRHRYGAPHFATSLVIACRHPELSPRFVKRLLRDVPPNTKNLSPEPIHYAARCGNHEVLRELMRHKKVRAFVQTARGRTALHWAVLGYRDAGDNAGQALRLDACVRLLAQWPALDVNQADEAGLTALHLAIAHKLPHAARAIVDSCREAPRPLQLDSYADCGETARQAVRAQLPELWDRLPPPPADSCAEEVHVRLLRAVDDLDPEQYARLLDVAADKEGFDPDQWVGHPFNTRLLLRATQLGDDLRPRLGDEERMEALDAAGSVEPLESALLARDFPRFHEQLDDAPSAVRQRCLLRVCRTPDLPQQFARELLRSGATPYTNFIEPQPLHYAARKANPEALMALLSHPDTRVNATDSSGRTALHDAAVALAAAQDESTAQQLERCVQLLVRCARLDVNRADALGISALHLAASKRSRRAVVAIISKCRSARRHLDVDSVVAGGRTARQVVAACLPDLARELPAQRPQRDPWPAGTSQPQSDPHCDRLELTEQLVSITLNFGVDIAAASLVDGRTALHAAAARDNPTILDLLLQGYQHSAPSEKRGKLKAAVNKKDLMSIRDRGGRTALDVAARGRDCEQNRECLRLLLAARGGRPATSARECQDARREILARSPAAHATANPRLAGLFDLLLDSRFAELLEKLEGGRAQPLLCESYCGYSLLQYAAEKGLCEVAKALVAQLPAQQVDLSSAWERSTRTPLMLACVHRDSEMVRLLLEGGCGGVNAIDSRKNTALHFAVENGDFEIVLNLLRYGADISVKNISGKCPFSTGELETLLDKSIYTEGNRLPSHKNYRIIFNYSLLLRHIKYSSVSDSYSCVPLKKPLGHNTKQKHLPSLPALHQDYSEMYFLKCLATSKEQTHLLHHPLIKSFLNMKYERARRFLQLNFTLCLAIAILATSFIVLSLNNISEDNNSIRRTVQIILLMMTFLLLLKEVLQMFFSPLLYVRNLENLTDILPIVFIVMITSDLSLGTASHAIYAITILLTWLKFFLVSGRQQLFSRNFEMFKRVSQNYMNLIASYLSVITAFSFSFYALFSQPITSKNSTHESTKNFSELSTLRQHNETNNNYNNSSNNANSSNDDGDSAFGSPVKSIFKTLIMMTGEFDSGDIPFDSHYWVSAVVFILFLFFLHVVLLNLLTALAISDEQEIRAKGETFKLVSLANFLWQTERTALSAHKFLKRWHCDMLAICLECLWVFHKVPADEACIGVLPNRALAIEISKNRGFKSHWFEEGIVHKAQNILKSRMSSEAEENQQELLLSELMKRLQSLEDKLQKLADRPVTPMV